MRRWAPIIPILAALVIGVILNVIVAWGFAMLGAVTPTGTRPTSDLTREDALEVLRCYSTDAPPRNVWATEYSRWGTTSRNVDVVLEPDEDYPGRLRGAYQSLSGWPSRSMGMAICGWSGQSKWDIVDALPAPAWCVRISSGRRYLPAAILWPGFAINTVFYAAIVWMLFIAPPTLRRRRRTKRGQCVKCGYDLRATQLPTCSECGATR